MLAQAPDVNEVLQALQTVNGRLSLFIPRQTCPGTARIIAVRLYVHTLPMNGEDHKGDLSGAVVDPTLRAL